VGWLGVPFDWGLIPVAGHSHLPARESRDWFLAGQAAAFYFPLLLLGFWGGGGLVGRFVCTALRGGRPFEDRSIEFVKCPRFGGGGPFVPSWTSFSL
jgi:hypothetical protein